MIYMYIRTVPDMSTDAPARISMKIKTIIDNKNLKCSSSFPFNPFHFSPRSVVGISLPTSLVWSIQLVRRSAAYFN